MGKATTLTDFWVACPWLCHPRCFSGAAGSAACRDVGWIPFLEPIVRKKPAEWLPRLEPWLEDDNKWVRRAGVTVIGRLPMKWPAHTSCCVELTERLLLDEEVDVKRAVSFALRIAARGQVGPVRDALARHVPPEDAAAAWVLCDAIRSMAVKLLPEFVSLLPLYEQWATDPTLSTLDRRSVESAVKTLQKAT